MREILFRGKSVIDGAWLYGYYVKTTDAITGDPVSIIIPQDGRTNPNGDMHANEVDPSTVGQFTGLIDSNGQRIFEGDIVSFSAPEYVKAIGDVVSMERVGEIVFIDSSFIILSENACFALSASAVNSYDVTVKSNVHDNPSLLTA